MDADDESTPPQFVPYPICPVCHAQGHSHMQMHRQEGTTLRGKAPRRAVFWRVAKRPAWRMRKTAAGTSQPSAEIQSSEEEDSTMSKVDASSHDEEESSDWMSQLFEKLDLEVYEDDAYSSEKVAELGVCPNVDGGISSEIYGTTQPGNDSTMFDKSGLEANEDSIYSTGKLAQVEPSPLVEGSISSETCISLEEKDSTMAKLTKGRLDDEDEYIDWLIKILKMEGADDILSRYNLDEKEENDVQDDGLVELCDPYKRVSKKETIKNGMKWMSEECFLAFTKYADKTNLQDINYKFGELLYQCLSIEACDKIFHHYNFTIEATHISSGVSTSDLYFAEVKQLSSVKSYFCCLLEENDEGHCYGCKSQGMSDLKHPSTSCYEEGAVDICWPFIDNTDSDSDDEDDSEDYSDCGGVGCD